jgi:hypothetical protein
MTSIDKRPLLLRQEEARSFLSAVQDSATRELMEMACDEVIRRFASGDGLPESDFDLLFFAESVGRFFGEHKILSRVLAGEDLAAEWD